jgi:hypothetical protein
MRRLLLLALLLFTAACSTAPRPSVQPVVPPAPVERGDLIGLTSGELIQRFGVPALQVREGTGLKLQFRGNRCILDAYLYPPANGRGAERVMHVDTRVGSGADTDQRTCIATLQAA